jgi:hypothetical protein
MTDETTTTAEAVTGEAQTDLVVDVKKLDIAEAAQRLKEAETAHAGAIALRNSADEAIKATTKELREATAAFDAAYRDMKPKRKSPERKPKDATVTSITDAPKRAGGKKK